MLLERQWRAAGRTRGERRTWRVWDASAKMDLKSGFIIHNFLESCSRIELQIELQEPALLDSCMAHSRMFWIGHLASRSTRFESRLPHQTCKRARELERPLELDPNLSGAR